MGGKGDNDVQLGLITNSMLINLSMDVLNSVSLYPVLNSNDHHIEVIFNDLSENVAFKQQSMAYIQGFQYGVRSSVHVFINVLM